MNTKTKLRRGLVISPLSYPYVPGSILGRLYWRFRALPQFLFADAGITH
jgi:hypothetical protein